MLKARAGNHVILGIEDGNIQRLREGKPIHIFLAEMGFQTDMQILIFWAKDHDALVATIKPFVGPETVEVKEGDKH